MLEKTAKQASTFPSFLFFSETRFFTFLSLRESFLHQKSPSSDYDSLTHPTRIRFSETLSESYNVAFSPWIHGQFVYEGTRNCSSSNYLLQANKLERLEQIHRDIFPISFYRLISSGMSLSFSRMLSTEVISSHGLLLIVAGLMVILMNSLDLLLLKSCLPEKVAAKISDLIRYDSSKGEETLVYILTLGVVETYRKRGIAKSLINEVIKYASGIPVCRGVYLHVIAHNNHAIRLYKRMSFRCVRLLHGFYLINGQHFDSYLFVHFINGYRSPCSPLYVAVLVLNYMRSGIKSVASKLTLNQEEKGLKWPPKCKDNSRFLLPTQTKRNIASERLSSGYDYV